MIIRLFNDFTGIGGRPAAANSSDSRRLRRRCALGLERLEDRVVLSTFEVTNLADNGLGSLRQAILDSNSTPGPNKIDFDPGLSGTITLTGGELQIMNNAVMIVGPGANQLSVSGNNASRVFEVDAVQAAISGLTITGGGGGFFQGFGRGLDNNGGTVTIAACTISDNEATAGGGGIANSGTMTIIASTISGNTSGFHGGGGGGIENLGTVTIVASTISGNGAIPGGGGIENFGTATIVASTISGNGALFGGGGIENLGTVTIVASTISGNSARDGNDGGGIANSGTVTIVASTISDNSAGENGGGIFNDGGTLTITGSRIRHNSAALGGGIYSRGGKLKIIGSTISDNSGGDIIELP